MHINKILLPGLFFAAFGSAFFMLVRYMTAAPVEEDSILVNKETPYNLSKPDAIWKTGITEISGICFADSMTIAAVQDEWARVDFINTQSGKVISNIAFGGKGDFEDITMVDKKLLILRSDGNLYLVDRETGKKKVLHTDVPKSANSEGLWFDPEKRRLLIASKYRGSNNKKEDRTIYSIKWDKEYDTKTLDAEKKWKLDGDDIADIYNYKLLSRIDKGRSSNDVIFQPSALARNPLDGSLWIVSGNPPGIAILDNEGELKKVIGIPATLWPQPEGMTFGPDGTLYIASEITNAIYVYHPRKRKRQN